MIIYLVRHAEAITDRDKGDRANIELGLSGFGKLEAMATAKALARLRIERIFASPITRARETAEAIGKVTSLDVAYDGRLREFFADPDSLDVAYLRNLKLQSKQNPDLVMPCGESLNQAVARLSSALNEFAELPDKAITVVSHRFVAQEYLAKVLGVRLAPDESLRTASVTALHFTGDGKVKVLFYNRRFRDLPLLLETARRHLRW